MNKLVKLYLAGLVTAIFMVPAVWAGNVTIPNTFTSGTPAVAAEVNGNFSAVETEVNDNASAISNKTGVLVDSRVANLSITSDNTLGFKSVLTSYVPTVNVTAVVNLRCTVDGNAAGQLLSIRVATRTPSGTGSVLIGSSFYLQTKTSAVNSPALNVNHDYFSLDAGSSYDIGANIIEIPTGGTSTDYCSLMVNFYRR